MKVLCQLSGDRCGQCGEPLPPGLRRTCKAGPRAEVVGVTRGPCAHLGEATGAVELIQCRSCCGNVRKKYPIYACAVLVECLPTYDGRRGKRQGCKACGSYSPKDGEPLSH